MNLSAYQVLRPEVRDAVLAKMGMQDKGDPDVFFNRVLENLLESWLEDMEDQQIAREYDVQKQAGNVQLFTAEEARKSLGL